MALHPVAIQGKEGIKFCSVALRSHSPEAQRAKHIQSKNLAIWQPCLRVAVARLEHDPLDVDLPHGLEVHGEVGGVDLRQVEGDVQLAAVLEVHGLDLVALGVDSTGTF